MLTDAGLWALANDMNCSAGQLLASAASRRLVTQTARTGSIGVMMAHSNYGAALEKQGVEITLIYSGSHKVDGNPYSHLPGDVRETLQSRMDASWLRGMAPPTVLPLAFWRLMLTRPAPR